MGLKWIFRVTVLVGFVLILTTSFSAFQRRRPSLDEPFRGVTNDGTVRSGLYSIRSTGVSTGPVRDAAQVFIDGLTDEQRQVALFAADDIEWRKWDNVHRAPRDGIGFRDMTEVQRELAFGLMRASLSAEGLEESQNIMRLNGHLADLLQKYDEYGEWRYWISIMGEPSENEPWGWQLDGHHLVINYFVLGDQVVMSPTFMGSEPVRADSGRFKGISVLQDEQNKGLALMQSLSAEQQQQAIIQGQEKTRGNSLAQAYNDNLVLDFTGIRASNLNSGQRTGLLKVIEEYVGNMSDDHAAIRMDEVEAHLDETYFAWIGEVGDDAVFYYRIHSPVILIEFDHQGPIALEGPRVPSRQHIHSVMRTPNGNDYGKDLLRQHYEKHRNDPAHGHQH